MDRLVLVIVLVCECISLSICPYKYEDCMTTNRTVSLSVHFLSPPYHVRLSFCLCVCIYLCIYLFLNYFHYLVYSFPLMGKS